MTRHSVSLHTGPDRPYHATTVLLGVLACTAILSGSGALFWKAVALVLTAAIAIAVWRHGQAAEMYYRVRLYRDGSVILRLNEPGETRAVLARGAWVSRWFVVLPVRIIGNRPLGRIFITVSRNHPDDYRLLLQWLRSGVAPPDSGGMLGH